MRIRFNFLFYIFLLIFSYSCTLLLNIQGDQVPLKKKVEVPTFCGSRKINGVRHLSKSKFIKSSFFKALKEKRLSLSQEETFVLLVLTQMSLRPDVVSPASSIQFLLKKNKHILYFDFNQKNAGVYPLYNTLVFLLKRSKSKYSISKMAKLSKNLFPRPYKISKNLAENLFKYKEKLKKHSLFIKTYFKSNQILQEGESFNGINLNKILIFVKKYKQDFKIPLNYQSPAFIKIDENPRSKIFCNQNLKIFSKDKYNITRDDGQFFLPMGFSLKNRQSVMAVIKSKISEDITPSFNSPIFKTKSTDAVSTFCYNNEYKKSIQLVSIKGRDSSQYIRNFLNSNMDKIQTQLELSQIIEFPRSLFLINPKRYIFESNRSQEKSTQNILSNNFPVYHWDTLGELWTMIDSQNIREFVSDTRSQSFHLCR